MEPLISIVHCVSGTLTVNVSVLLLSLASPDESSLVIDQFSLIKSVHAYESYASVRFNVPIVSYLFISV